MAIPNSAGSVALDTNEVTIFNAETCGGICGAFWCQNDAASAGNALVNVPGLHKSGEFVPLTKAVVDGITFRIKKGSITTVTAKAATTATLNFAVLEK